MTHDILSPIPGQKHGLVLSQVEADAVLLCRTKVCHLLARLQEQDREILARAIVEPLHRYRISGVKRRRAAVQQKQQKQQSRRSIGGRSVEVGQTTQARRAYIKKETEFFVSPQPLVS